MNDEVKMIPLDQIRILNPRHRDKKKFEMIVQSIKNLGLKKPIQVSLRGADEGEGPPYDLVCGQGRMEAFRALGHREIPAVVVGNHAQGHLGARCGKTGGGSMSENKGKVAFEMRKREVELTKLLPTKPIKDPHNLRRYKAIVDSIPEIGLIEPLMVYPQKSGDNWLVLDGHLRLLALKQLGWKTVDVIVATEDDRYTYNARVNRLPPIQAHKMIVKAVRNGIKPERIAKALFMPMNTVSALLNLLDGINPEAVDLLKDKQITVEAVRQLKKVTGLRQIEIAEVMVSANNFTKSYAEALVLATSKDQMLAPQEPKKKAGLTAEELARMEREMESLEKDFKSIEANYTENMMSLTLARGYIKRLLENSRVLRHLRDHHGELLTEFEGIAAAERV